MTYRGVVTGIAFALASPAFAQASADQVAEPGPNWLSPIIAILLIAGGAWVLRWGWRTNNQIDRYEFENRSDGGVIRFTDFEAARRHGLRKTLGFMSVMGGPVAILIGLVTMLFFYGSLQ